MTKFPNISIAGPGLYFGLAKDIKTNRLTDEVITCSFLKNMEMKYIALPVTYEHDDGLQIGFMNNLKMVSGKLVGDLYIADELFGLDNVYDKYISPEIVIDDHTGMAIDIVKVSVVKYPAIFDNTPIVKTNAVVIPYNPESDISEEDMLAIHNVKKQFI